MIEKYFFKNFFNRKSLRKKILSNYNEKKINKNYLISYKQFGKSYFDNDKIGIGYGSYKYDGRFKKSAKKLIKFFNLKKNDKILEIGCAKGYFLVEFFKLGMNVIGIDKSKYAKKKSHSLIKKYIKNFDIEKKMIFKNKDFDFVFCKEVFPHIRPNKIISIIKEMKRVVKNPKNIYIEIQTFEKKSDKQLFKKWDLTHKSCYTKNEWLKIFKKNNFTGYISFKNLF